MGERFPSPPSKCSNMQPPSLTTTKQPPTKSMSKAKPKLKPSSQFTMPGRRGPAGPCTAATCSCTRLPEAGRHTERVGEDEAKAVATEWGKQGGRPSVTPQTNNSHYSNFSVLTRVPSTGRIGHAGAGATALSPSPTSRSSRPPTSGEARQAGQAGHTCSSSWRITDLPGLLLLRLY